MNNTRKRLRITALFCTVILLFAFCAFSLTTGAANDQNTAQLSVKLSNDNPAKGETVKVTASIDNYRTMSQRISAMSISLSFDSTIFSFVADSAKPLLLTKTGDVVNVLYDGSGCVNFAYVYANSRKALLNEDTVELFEFQLTVRADLAEKAPITFKFDDVTMYNGKDTSKYTLIPCKDPIYPTATAWVTRPPILLNGTATNAGTYKENVTIVFDTASASLVYEGREPVTVSSPYLCNRNGDYKVTVNYNGVDYSESFTIDKEIQSIAVKSGTLQANVLMGMSPDYSSGILIVKYADGTSVNIPMTDPDITVTGFDATALTEQRLIITYKGKTTSYTVTVIQKTVVTVSISSGIAKTTYLQGQELEVTGGKIFVSYDDSTNEILEITPAMLAGYDKNIVGQQQISLTYGTAPAVIFTVTVISRANVDQLISSIEAIDLATITETDKETISALSNTYNSLSDVEKAAVTNAAKLQNAITMLNSLIGNVTTTDTDSKPVSTNGDQATEGTGDNTGNIQVIWIVIAVIVGLSVLAGIIYFLVVYFGRKKELDEDEYYYEDDDTDDDGNEDLSYGDDLLESGDDDDDDEDGGTKAAGEEDDDD